MVVNTTTYIGLAKPTEDELALNWTRVTDIVEDNNTQIIDKCDVNIQSRTPNLIGRLGNPSVGAGSRSLEFIDYEGFVFGSCNLVFTDPGVAVGSAEWGVELPFVVHSTYHVVGTALNDAPGPLHCIGEGYYYDSSAVATSGTFAVDAVTVAGVSYARFISETFAGKASRIIGSASPVAIATGDRITFSFMFKKA
jgi:hypothetical protein